jgi:hypothetical protein
MLTPARAAPGLIGHRLFDRDAEVGDLRITRSDYPLWWFIRANHRMTLDVILRVFPTYIDAP